MFNFLNSVQSAMVNVGNVKSSVRSLKNQLGILNFKNVLNGVFLHPKGTGALIKGSLTNLETSTTKYFQFNPEEIKYSRSAEYSSIKSPGMQYPAFYFVNGGEKTFTLELFMYDNPSTGKIKSYEKFFETLLPAEDNSNAFKKPSEALYVLGSDAFKVVLNSYEVKHEMWDKYMNPTQSRFTLSFTKVGGVSI